jgi:catechol 2,3-dioxygenase-like lactoylglutathione lyase family enzyme
MHVAGRLHHVEIYVADLARATEFWGWLLGELGYELYSQWPKGIDYKLGDTYIVFVQAEERFLDPPYHRCRPGLNHLAFHAASRAQVDDLTAKLKARGAPILYEDRHPYAGGPDYYAVFFEDPERMKVEIVAPQRT